MKPTIEFATLRGTELSAAVTAMSAGAFGVVAADASTPNGAGAPPRDRPV